MLKQDQTGNEKWDTSSHQAFQDYYAKQSLSQATLDKFQAIQALVMRMLGESVQDRVLDVLDIGCGAGSQCRIWAEGGHRVVGLDVNAPLIELAQARAKEQGLEIHFHVGSATELPLEDCTFDVCLLPELLEHVADWEKCLKESVRVLKPGGVLYLSTSNKLCPFQQEFNLPLYSWYPASIKRHYEKLAVTTRPDLANYATYPAVNWFTFFQLKHFLAHYGLTSFDRFDVMDVSRKPWLIKVARALVQSVPGLRFIAHVFTPYTVVLARKKVH